MTIQLTFSLPVRTAMGVEDFIVTESNGNAVSQLDHWPDWPARTLVLRGDQGAGKTHLAQVWAQKSNAPLIASHHCAAQLETLLQHQQLIIEDIDNVFGDESGEHALFHLWNHCQQQGHMLLTTQQAPAQAAIVLPDLRSRLRAAPLLTLQPPDDTLLAALLIKHFNDRQLRVGQDVVDYLLSRIERSAAAAAQAVDALDQAALLRRHRITVPLARQVLEQQTA
jgi:DnaA regulatory inactivator Hda